MTTTMTPVEPHDTGVPPDTNLCRPGTCGECDETWGAIAVALTTEPEEVPDPALVAEQDESSPTHADLQARVAELEEERVRLEQQLETKDEEGLEWIEKLLDRAHQAADRHNLCEVYDDVMREMGLPGRWANWVVSVQVTFDLTFNWRARANGEEADGDWSNHLNDEVVIAAIQDAVRYGNRPSGLEYEIQEYDVEGS